MIEMLCGLSKKWKVNYSTTYKIIRFAILFLMVNSLFVCSVSADEAIERIAPLIPLGDVLVVYSDGASAEDVEAVSDIVEILTYQAFQVSYGTATQAVKAAADFDYVVCYEVEKYPQKLVQELIKCEDNGGRLFFIGNQLIKSYADQQNRISSQYGYMASNVDVGKVTYSFDSSANMTGLVKEDGFIFLTRGIEQESGMVEAGDKTGNVAANNETITHMSIGDMQNDMVRAIFSREIAKWKWTYDSDAHVYAQYIVLNEVYPFQDPEKLLQTVNLLVHEQEPFVISVMPVYVNADYPAMQKFCEVLRYAQDNGGAIIMHTPLNQRTTLDADMINEYVTLAMQNYMAQGVYPIGLQAPVDWMFDENGIEVLSRFSTVFTCDEEDGASEFSEDMHTNEVYKDGHQWVGPAIALDNSGVSYTSVYSTAVYINFTEELSQIEDQIHACQSSFVPLKSLWDVEHTFWTDKDLLLYKNGILTVNSERRERTYEPAEEETEAYEYNRNTLKRFSRNLAEENQKLVVVVVVVSVLFIIFLYTARHNNKRRFFYKDPEPDPDSDSDTDDQKKE